MVIWVMSHKGIHRFNEVWFNWCFSIHPIIYSWAEQLQRATPNKERKIFVSVWQKVTGELRAKHIHMSAEKVIFILQQIKVLYPFYIIPVLLKWGSCNFGGRNFYLSLNVFLPIIVIVFQAQPKPFLPHWALSVFCARYALSSSW